MGETTAISWCHHTFNTWWGCVKVSPACTNCYAERDAKRYGHEIWGPTARRRFFSEKHWAEPLKWNAAAEKAGERRRVFCSSMADVFEMLPADHPDADAMGAARARLFDDLIPRTPWLDWLILSKRTRAMSAWSQRSPFAPNVIAMTTAEDQKYFDERIVDLLATRAHRRGLSLEPLLGSIDLWPWSALQACGACLSTQPEPDMAACVVCGSANLRPALSWVITGGESGPKARPTHPDWVRALRDQCVNAGIAFHHKQNGEWLSASQDEGAAIADCVTDPSVSTCPTGRKPRWKVQTLQIDVPGKTNHADGFMMRIGKKAAGRLLDGREWNEFPAEVANA